MIYLDAGCLVKLYCPEPESQKVAALVAGKPICYNPLHERASLRRGPGSGSRRISQHGRPAEAVGRRNGTEIGDPLKEITKGNVVLSSSQRVGAIMAFDFRQC